MYSQANTNNPLGQRPLNLLATLNGISPGLGSTGSSVVPAGTLFSYVGAWWNPLTMLAATVVEQVAARLASDGLPVRSQSYDLPILGDLRRSQFTVRLMLQVTGSGYAQIQDAISIIRHEVLEVTGSYPLSDSVPSVQLPGGGPPLTTGQPGSPAVDDPNSWSHWAKDNAGLIGVGIAATFIGAMLIRK